MLANKRLKLVPYLLVFYEIAVFLSNDMYLPSMPAIGRELLLSQNEIQSTLTFWFLGAGCFQFILGPVSDRYGRKNVLLLGALIFIVSSAVCAIADTLTVMLVARFFQGTALCSLVAANAAVHESFSTKRAIKIIALMGAISILAPAFGPLLGAMIVQFANWRWIFWLFVIMGSLSLISMWLYLPESNNNKHPLHIKTIIKDYKKILTNSQFMAANLCYCFLVGVYFFWMFESPFIIIEVYQKSTLYYGISQTAIFSLFLVTAWLIKVLLQRYTIIFIIRASMLLSFIAAVILVLVSWLYPSMLLAVLLMMIIALGTSLLFGPINRVAIEASKEPMGRRTAVFSTTISLFGAFCGWILMIITSKSLLAVSLLILAAMICAALLIVPINASAFDEAAEDLEE